MFAEREVDLGTVEGLFKEVKYYVTGNISENVQKVLATGEAKKTAYLSGINTHCIVGYDPDMNEVSEATDMLDVPSVDQDWVIASAQAREILPIKPFSPGEGRLFIGVTACTGEMSPDDMTKLWAMLSWHGGKMTRECGPGVTHVIINKPVGDLYTSAMTKDNIKIVTGAWVLETVKNKSKMNEELYHPRLLLIPENKAKEKPKPKPKPKPVAQPPAQQQPSPVKVQSQQQPTTQSGPTPSPVKEGSPMARPTGPTQAQQQQQRMQQLQHQKQQQLLQQQKIQQQQQQIQLQKQQQQQQTTPTSIPSHSTAPPQQQQQKQEALIPVSVEQKTIIIGQGQPATQTQHRPGGGATIITPISQQNIQQQQQQQNVQQQQLQNTQQQQGATIIQNINNPGQPQQTGMRPGGIINMLPQQPVSLPPDILAKQKMQAAQDGTVGEKPQPMPQPQQQQQGPQQGVQAMIPNAPSTNTTMLSQTTTIQPASTTTQQQGGQPSSQIQPQQPASQQSNMGDTVQGVQITQTQQHQAVSQASQQQGGPQTLTSGTIIVPQSQKTNPQIINSTAQPVQTSVTQQQFAQGQTLQHPQQQTAQPGQANVQQTPGQVQQPQMPNTAQQGNVVRAPLHVNNPQFNQPQQQQQQQFVQNTPGNPQQAQQMGQQQQQSHPAILQQHDQQLQLQQQQQQQQQQHPQMRMQVPQQQQQMQVSQPQQQQMQVPQTQQQQMQVPQTQQQQMQPQQQMQQMRMQNSQQQQQGQWQGQMRPQQPQQGQFVNPNGGQVIQQQQQQQQPQQHQQWTAQQQQQQQQLLQHRQRQQQIIQQHISTLSLEQREQFTRMDAKEKQQYLASRNLLLPQPQWSNGQQVQLQRHTIQLTEQQRVTLENMNPQQRAIYLNKLRTEKEAQLRQQQMMQQRQQMLIQQQQQQQQQGGQQPMMMQQGRQMVMGGQPQQVMMQQQPQQILQQQQPGMIQQGMAQPQQPQQQQPQQQWGGATPTSGYPQHSSPAPMSPIQQMGNLSPGHVSPNRMPSPVQNPGLRQAWSGDPHPALAQVPRTPQQIQHLQRLQMQRQQGEGGNPGEQPMPAGSVAGPGTMQQSIAQPQQMIMGQPTNTKVALQNMLTNRIGPGGQTIQGGPGPMSPDVSPNPRMQMMNPQMQGGMMQQTPQSPQQMQMIQQQQQMQQQQQQRQQQLMALQQQRAQMVSPGHAVQGHGHQQMMASGPGGPGGMQVTRFPPRVAGAVMTGMRPQMAPGLQQQRMQQFVGHDIQTRLPPDLCLLGCIFVIVDYQDMEEAKHLPEWRKVITQYGGEIEDSISPRVTHVMAANQKSATAQQARVEGKRLITAYWLNDTIVKKKVLPPWKAVHFPLPANYEPPCTNMILTLTGFEERDRDFVKDMIKMAGATYTGYFTKHNHAIICKRPMGEKFEKAREWRVPAVAIAWLNDVLFGSSNAAQSMNNPRYQQFKPEEPLRIDYNLIPHLIQAWKSPIRISPETYQKFKANPPARIRRKAEKQRQERDAEEKRKKENEERALQGLPPLEGPLPGQAQGGDQPQPVSAEQPGPVQTPKPEPMEQGEAGEAAGASGQPGAEQVEAKMEVETEKQAEGVKMEVDEEKEKGDAKPKVMMSGMENSQRKQMTEIIERLGGGVTEDPGEASHLVMPRLARTNNFLLCLPRVRFILRPEWVTECGAQDKWVTEEGHTIEDPEMEARFNFSLARTLARANRDKLFSGKVFYLTPSVKPSLQILSQIIQASGGRVENRRRKTTEEMKEMNSGGGVNYVVITCEEDIHLVTDVLRSKLGVFNAEFVLSAVTKCEMDFDLSRYLTTT